MAGINQLQLPPMANVPQVDFSPLAKLADVYRQGQMRAELAQLAANGQQPSLEQVAQVALRHGDPETFKGIASLAQANAYQMANLGLRGREVSVMEQQARENKAPPTVTMYGPTGKPMTGMWNANTRNYDPVGSEKVEEKELGFGDIRKNAQAGGKYQSINKLTDTFDPEYAGWVVPGAGELANTLASNVPSSMLGKDGGKRVQAADWWREYQAIKNEFLNTQFGATVPPAEMARFESASVNPANLQVQREIIKNAIKNEITAGGAAKYNTDALAKSYGIDPKELGIAPTGQPTSSPRSAPAVTPSAALSEARAALAKRPDLRDAIINRLKEKGIDPTGL
jgi:hypothetical protein